MSMEMRVKFQLAVLIHFLFWFGSVSFAGSVFDLTALEREAGQNFVNFPLKAVVQQQTKEKIYRAVAQGYVSQIGQTVQEIKNDSELRNQKIASVLQFANAFSKLGYFAEGMNEFDASVSFYKRALGILNQLPRDTAAYAYGENLQRIFRVYHDAAVHLESQGKLQEAMIYFNKAYQTFEEGGLIKGLFTSEVLSDRYVNLIRHMQLQSAPICKAIFLR